jgi:hypothetical protein
MDRYSHNDRSYNDLDEVESAEIEDTQDVE